MNMVQHKAVMPAEDIQSGKELDAKNNVGDEGTGMGTGTGTVSAAGRAAEGNITPQGSPTGSAKLVQKVGAAVGEASCGAAEHAEGETCAQCAADHGYLVDKKRYLSRLKRIEGQVRGVQRMVAEEQYCIDILTQIAALQSALKSVSLALFDDHLQHCVLHAAQAGGVEAEAKLAEASAAIARLVR